MSAGRPGGTGEACITCGDVAAPMRALEVDRAALLATCRDEAGATCTVDIGVVPDANPGDVLLVHAGTALQALGEEAA